MVSREQASSQLVPGAIGSPMALILVHDDSIPTSSVDSRGVCSTGAANDALAWSCKELPQGGWPRPGVFAKCGRRRSSVG